MATPAHIITCTKTALIAPGVYELRFDRPETMTFKAGQFLLFDIPLLNDPADIQTRALSVASTPLEKELIFVIKIKPEGRLGMWIEHACRLGTSVRVQGPLGLFTVKDERTLVFVATGAGIAPFRSQVKSLLEEEKDMRTMHLVFGVRGRDDFFWTDDFVSLAARYPHFHFHPTLSGVDAEWQGKRGRVQTHLADIVGHETDVGAYVCGAPAMVQDVKEVCIQTLGLPKAKVHAEGYI